jgi:hypothetical protein
MVSILFVAGCNKEDESDKVDISLENRNNYIELAKEFSSNIHSNKNMEELGSFFTSKKSLVENETFLSNFELSKLENQGNFSADYSINESSLGEIFIEEMKDGLVSILIVTSLEIEETEFDEHGDMFSSTSVDINVIDLYRFKDGKMVEYIQYW